jgi:hypothetical protein
VKKFRTPPSDEPYKTSSLRMPTRLWEQVRQIGLEKKWSDSLVISELVEFALKERGKNAGTPKHEGEQHGSPGVAGREAKP